MRRLLVALAILVAAPALAQYEETIIWLEAPRTGRLFVFYFQTDFAMHPARIAGQMHALLYVDRIIEQIIQPEDRVAVVSFDSHLRLQLDFTGNKAEIRKASQRTLAKREPPPPPTVPGPSLAACLDRATMRRLARDEQALLYLARALREIPGEKQLLFIGTHLGYQIGMRMFAMDPVWEEAKRELLAANVIVNGFYAMAPGMSGSLAIGVQKAAAETGGFFVTASPRGLARMRDGAPPIHPTKSAVRCTTHQPRRLPAANYVRCSVTRAFSGSPPPSGSSSRFSARCRPGWR